MNALYTTWILLLFMVAGFSQPVSAITSVETSRSPVSYEEFYDHFSYETIHRDVFTVLPFGDA